MIIQKVYCENQNILTIVHVGMDNGIEDRKIHESIHISEYKILFEEFYIEDYKLPNISEYDFKIEGFLDLGNEKNPYKYYCAYYKEYVFLNKKFNIDNLSNKEFKELYDFVKEYTNFNITKMNINNILCFYPTKITVNSVNSKPFPYLKIISSEKINQVSVKFKLDDIILESFILKDITKTENIYSNVNWNNYDIEIFNKEKLIYKSNTSILTEIEFIFNLDISNRYTTLSKTNTRLSISNNDNNPEEIKMSIDEDLNEISSYLTEESKEIKKLLKKSEEEFDCIFLRKNEREKAYKTLTKLVKQQYDEMFIFDPYFLSNNFGKVILTDLLKILLQNNITKHIIFSKEKYSFEDFEKTLSKNEILFFEDIGVNKINFIESKEDFHDRFIFFINKNKIIGYQIGTSLNSYGENYSNLIKLKEGCCEKIFNILQNEIMSETSFNIGESNEYN